MTPLGKWGSSVYINSQDSREEVRGFPGESRAVFVGPQSQAQYLALRGTQSMSLNQWMDFNHFWCGRPFSRLGQGPLPLSQAGERWLSLCWANLDWSKAVTGLPTPSRKWEGPWVPSCISPKDCQHPAELPGNVTGKRRRVAFAFSWESVYQRNLNSVSLNYSLSLSVSSYQQS